jgi:hypothetical protein
LLPVEHKRAGSSASSPELLPSGPRGGNPRSDLRNGLFEFPALAGANESPIAAAEVIVPDGVVDGNQNLLDDLLDMENTVELIPPLTDLPHGTDIGALARQIEGLSNVDDNEALYYPRK